MIPKEQNMPTYTSRRYSWPGKKVPRDLEDREKSGGESGGDSFSPDADYERRISYHASEGLRARTQAMSVISLMYRNRVINGIIAAYNVTRCYIMLTLRI